MKDFFFLIIGLVFIFGSFFLFLENPKESEKRLILGDISIIVEIADTNIEKARGLSGRNMLEEGKGILLVFEEDDYHGIWMKNMKFPIDIIWLDKEFRVISIEKNVLPETYPKVFLPTLPARYVLELNASHSTRYNIDTGTQLSFE